MITRFVVILQILLSQKVAFCQAKPLILKNA